MKSEDTAVPADEPVPAGGPIDRHAYDRLIKRLASHRPVVHGIAERVDAPVRTYQPIAPVIGRERHRDDGGVLAQSDR